MMPDDSENSNVISFKKPTVEGTNFKIFAQYIVAKDMTKASRALRDILNLSYERAEEATVHFNEVFKENQGAFLLTMDIKNKIIQGHNNEALMLIYKLFGLQSIDGLLALEAMREIIQPKK